MQDFDYDRAGRQFSIHPLFAVQMMIAVGRPGNSTNLPETLRAKDVPTQRKPVSAIAFENRFSCEE
jgi:hypothetical protein